MVAFPRKMQNPTNHTASVSPRLRAGHLWILAFSVLFGYLAYRAFALSFTHDESLSYTIARLRSPWRTSANHHPLNTWLMAVSGSLFGDSELSLRLHSLGAFVVSAVFSLRLFSKDPRGIPSLTYFAVLFLNPLVIEFFALARGYALSIACVAASLYFLLLSACSRPWRTAFSVTLAALAASANLAALNYLIAVVLVSFVQMWMDSGRRAGFRAHLVSGAALVLGALSILAVGRWLWFLRSLGQLYSGSETAGEAVFQVIAESVGSDSPGMQSLVAGLGCAIVAVALALVLSRRASRALVVIAIVLTVIIAAIFGQRVYLGTQYPPPRAATYLMPIIAMIGFLVVRDAMIAARSAKGRLVASVVIVGVFGLMAVNFAKSVNVSFAPSWKYDAETKQVARVLEAVAADSPGMPAPTFANHWLFEPTLNYYIRTRKMPTAPADREGMRAGVDFIYTFAGEGVPPGYVPLVEFSVADATLYVADSSAMRVKAEAVARRFEL